MALVPLTSCANGQLAGLFQRSVAPDPRLSDNANPLGSPSPTPESSPNPALQLPADFPNDLRYPGATLLAVDSGSGINTDITPAPAQTIQTRWSTPDTPDKVKQFYQNSFDSGRWTIQQPSPDTSTTDKIVAEKDGQQVTVAFASVADVTTPTPTDNTVSPSPAATGSPTVTTEFVLSYQQTGGATSAGNAMSQTPSASPDISSPVTPSPSASSAASRGTPLTFKDLDQAPQTLRQYIQDLGQLGVFSTGVANKNSDAFKPNAIATRREYARWLATANNLIYTNRPAQQIRLGNSSEQPIFQDVPRSDPDFPIIQGLAEAGIIPSPLSGDATTVTFRPNAPLTRETLILWKIPLDTHQNLPNATVQAIQQSWGFQDAGRIDPRALRAVLADYQNGDLSNIRRAFGYTTLFQPKKSVTRAEAAAVLWYFGSQGDGISAHDALQGQQSR